MSGFACTWHVGSRKISLHHLLSGICSMPNGNLNPDSRHLKTQLTSLKNNGWNPTMEVWFKWFSFIYWVIIRFQPLIFRGVINNRMPQAHVTPLEVSKTLEKKTWRHIVCNTRVYPSRGTDRSLTSTQKTSALIGDRLLPRKVLPWKLT